MEKKRRKTRRISNSCTPIRTGKEVHGNEVHGLYRKIDLSTLDGRTRLGKAAKEIQADLKAYAGKGTVITDILIDQITYKLLRLKLYQARNIYNNKDYECAHALPLSNSLRLDMQELAKQVGEAKAPMSLEDYLQGLEAGK